MFRAARMVKVDLQIPQSSISGTTCIIANLKILHLMNIRKTRIGELDLKSNEDNNLLCKYKELRGRVGKIFPALGIDPDDLSSLSPQGGIDPYKILFEID